MSHCPLFFLRKPVTVTSTTCLSSRNELAFVDFFLLSHKCLENCTSLPALLYSGSIRLFPQLLPTSKGKTKILQLLLLRTGWKNSTFTLSLSQVPPTVAIAGAFILLKVQFSPHRYTVQIQFKPMLVIHGLWTCGK